MDEFTESYIETALWSSTDDDGEPLDEDFSVDDIDTETIEEMEKDAADFQESNADLLDRAYGHDNASEKRAGHDFWLTRNRHGAGFWDGDYPTTGNELTEASHAYGEYDLYVGDDDKIYGN